MYMCRIDGCSLNSNTLCICVGLMGVVRTLIQKTTGMILKIFSIFPPLPKIKASDNTMAPMKLQLG